MPSLSFWRSAASGFALQEPPLALRAQAVAAELAVAADDAVAGYDERHWVGGAGMANGALGVRLTNGVRDLAVAAGLAKRNPAQFLPYTALEGGGADIERQVDVRHLAGDEVDDLLDRRVQDRLAMLDLLGCRELAVQLIDQLVAPLAQADETDPTVRARDQ